MFYFPDSQIEQWLLDDISLGDVTTRALGIGNVDGRMIFSLKHDGRVSGIAACRKLLKKLDIDIEFALSDGVDVPAGTELLVAVGKAANLHQGWKSAQNILEWASGVASYVAEMIALAVPHNPAIRIACTRKSIPGTKFLASAAVVDGGGIIHRCGIAESILLFANHRRFLPNPNDWNAHVARLRVEAPEKKIIVEVDTMEEAAEAVKAGPDILQLDKFSLGDVSAVLELAKREAPRCQVSVAGGVSRENVAGYAKTGAHLIVTSAPYGARPADVKARLMPV